MPHSHYQGPFFLLHLHTAPPLSEVCFSVCVSVSARVCVMVQGRLLVQAGVSKTRRDQL